MSPLKTSVLVAPLAALATLAALFFLHQSRAREARSLRDGNDRLRRTAFERLNPALAAHAPVPAGPVAVAAPTPAPADSTPRPPAPAPLYRDDGRATPLAALQTLAWACDRGDDATVSRMLYFDPAAQKKAEAYFASLPADTRAHWQTVNDMAATLLTRDIMEHPFPAAEILATATTEPLSPDRVVVRLPGTPKDGSEYQRTATGWSYAITEAAVDAYLARRH
jgi:hypothetical protein